VFLFKWIDQMKHLKDPPDSSPPPDWVQRGDMTFQDNTWFWRQLEERDHRTYFPKGRMDCVFDANGDGGNEDVFRLGDEIIRELCKGHTVLTTIKAYGSAYKQKEADLRNILFEKYADEQNDLFHEETGTLFILSSGFSWDASSLYADMYQSDCNVGICVFPQGKFFPTAEQAKTAADTASDTLTMSYHSWPNELHFDCNPQAVDINSIWIVVKRTCDRHHLTVTHPPELALRGGDVSGDTGE